MEILRYVVLANSLLAMVSLAHYVLLRHETFFRANRLVLWMGLAGTLMAPLLEFPDWRPQRVRTVMHRTAQVIVPHVLPKPTTPDVTITFPDQRTYQAFGNKPKQFVWTWQLGLAVLYLSGVLILVFRLGVQLLSLQRLIRQSAHESYNDFILVKSPLVNSPFSFFAWVILNPAQHTTEELEQVLRHERVHVRERHSIDMLGAELVCIIFWFNPAAYLFRYLIHQTLEFRADYAVLREGVDPKTYQYNLLKVSLLANSSSITNHFSKSQLKSRIAMLNRKQSAAITWLKYPIFLLALLLIASAFARHTPTESVNRYVPQPISKTFATLNEAYSVQPGEIIYKPENQPVNKPNNGTSTTISSSQASRIQADSVQRTVEVDSIRSSPSRYMAYQGKRLYWIVTPKTTFDDLAVMRKEFARHNNSMQLNEIKFDPLYAHISRIVFSVKKQQGGSTTIDDLQTGNKPIESISGYIGIDKNAGERSTGHIKAYKADFPEPLRKTALDDENFAAQFFKEHRLDYLISDGEQKFNALGSGASTYSKEFFKNKITRSSGVVVKDDGTLSIDERLGVVEIFVNNEATTSESIGKLKVNQIYSVIKKSQYNADRKESSTSAILIYTIDE